MTHKFEVKVFSNDDQFIYQHQENDLNKAYSRLHFALANCKIGVIVKFYVNGFHSFSAEVKDNPQNKGN